MSHTRLPSESCVWNEIGAVLHSFTLRVCVGRVYTRSSTKWTDTYCTYFKSETTFLENAHGEYVTGALVLGEFLELVQKASTEVYHTVTLEIILRRSYCLLFGCVQTRPRHLGDCA